MGPSSANISLLVPLQVLLGGTIGFFQSLCLLGYCLFPMDVAAIVCVTVDLMLVRCGRVAGWAASRRLVVRLFHRTVCSGRLLVLSTNG